MYTNKPKQQQFKEQLHNLMEMIRDTRPHYIRCVKPNDSAQPDTVHRNRVMEQVSFQKDCYKNRFKTVNMPLQLKQLLKTHSFRRPHVLRSMHSLHV
jgi:Myosin head (motor domain)